MNIFNNKALNATLRELGGSFAAQNDALITANSTLEDALRELIETARKNSECSAATEESFTNMLSKMETITGNFEQSARLLQESCDRMAQLKPIATQKELTGMNKLASGLNNLRTTIIDAMQGGDSRAIDKLNTISAALEKNIGATFTTIDKTLTANAEKLFASYERFFELCKTLSEAESAEPPPDTAALPHCPACGAVAQAEFQFCAVCGAKIETIEGGN